MPRTLPFIAVALPAAVLLSSCSTPSAPTDADALALETATISGVRLIPQKSGTINRLQAISIVNDNIVWASGLGGTYVVTTDGGQHWRAGVVPGARDLQFRDVHGVSDRVAYLMAAGEGTASRIYKTEDGGATWTLQFKNQDPAAFFDCFAFWGPSDGIVFSDPVSGRFPVRRTKDGKTWRNIGWRLPTPLEGEIAFAASGTCVATRPGGRGWIVTGGAERARVFVTTDYGDSWTAYNTPIVQGTAFSGGFSVAFRDRLHGILVGGDLEDEGVPTENAAVTSDGGRTWKLVSPTPFPGAAFGVSTPIGNHEVAVATGPGGAAYSRDNGEHWTLLPGVEDYWAVAFRGPQRGWLVGTEGRILKVSL